VIQTTPKNRKPKPTRNITLFKHQQRALDFFKQNHQAAIFYEMGLGKTLIALECYRSVNQNYDVNLLVFAPLSLVEGAWGIDIQKFTDYTWTNGHAKHKTPQHTNIYVYNYESLTSKRKYEEVLRLIKSKKHWMCVLDESSRMKSFNSITTKKLLKLRDLFQYRLVMSGTPAPNIEHEYWSQMNFVADVFDKSFYKFRNKYFHLQRGNQQASINFRASDMLRKGFKYQITDINRSQLMGIISRKAIFAKKRDCLDLPDQVDEIRYVSMGAEQKRVYKKMKTDMVTAIKEHDIVASTALTKLMKLRQITGGFVISDLNEPIRTKENPKLKELLAVLEESGDQQSIIWCQFRWEVETIKEILGDQAMCLYGATKDRMKVITSFMSEECKYLIAHPRSAGHGLTFTNTSLQIFYSLDYSWEAYEQSRARTHRHGQKKKCTYVHLLAKDTIDEIILDALKKKKSNDELLYRLLGDV